MYILPTEPYISVAVASYVLRWKNNLNSHLPDKMWLFVLLHILWSQNWICSLLFYFTSFKSQGTGSALLYQFLVGKHRNCSVCVYICTHLITKATGTYKTAGALLKLLLQTEKKKDGKW